MKDIPIMFSAPMILALDREAAEQGTGKTMTRRLAWGKHIGVDLDEEAARDMRRDGWKVSGPDDTEHRIAWPATPWQRVQIGQRLWVRENFWHYGRWAVKTHGAKFGYTFQPIAFPGGNLLHAAAQPVFLNDQQKGRFAQSEPAWHLRPNIFLPRAESRFTLVVTGTKIRRLQDMTDVECEREGVRWKREGAIDTYWVEGLRAETYTTFGYQTSFMCLWNHLHGTRAWDDNPEVVALTFTVHKQNIDALQVAA